MTDRVLLLLYPGSILHEVMLAVQVLGGALPLDVAAPTDNPHHDASGLRLLPTTTFATIDAGAYRCVLVPGGDPGSIMEDPEVDRILQGTHEAGALLGGICAGVLVLAKAGVLRGRRIVHNYREPWAPDEVVEFVRSHWEGAIVSDDLDQIVCQDERVVTALPNGHIDFALALSEALGVHGPEDARFFRAYHRGEARP